MDDEMIRVPCPHACGQTLKYPPHLSGKSVTCPRCKRKVALPSAPPSGGDDGWLEGDDASSLASGSKVVDWPSSQPPAVQPPAPVWQPPALHPPAPPVWQPPVLQPPVYPPPPPPVWQPPVPPPPAAPVWPVPAAPPPSPTEGPPRARRGGPIELDRNPQRREEIRRYFRGEQPASLLAALVFLIGGLLGGVVLLFAFPPCACLPFGLAVMGGIPALLRVLVRPAIATEEDVRECIREDRRAIERAAERRVAEFLAAVPSDRLPGWEAPQKFVGPCRVLDSADEKESVREDEQFRVTSTKRLHVAGSNVMFVILGTYQLVTYRIGVNHLTGQAFVDDLKEFFYQDVVTAQSTTLSRKFALGPEAVIAENPSLAFWLGLPIVGPILAYLFRYARSEVVWESFAIHSAGGTSSKVDLSFEYVSEAVEHQGAIDRKDTPEELAVRNRLREVKALTRREA